MTTVAAETETDPLDRALAARVETGGDRKAAADLLVKWCLKDPPLFQAIMEASLEARCWNWIRRAERFAKSAGTSSGETSQDPAILRAGSVHILTIYMRTLPNGKPLGDANQEDLADAISEHQALRVGNARMAWWYMQIKKNLGEDIVRNVYTPAALEELLAEAGGRFK